MADETLQFKHQSATNPQNKTHPSKFFSHFLFKPVIFTIFLAIIPLFPSESPDSSSSQSIYTMGWELLYLISVGIAVSYGLFSRRRKHNDLECENNSKLENAHTYMSRFLQFPSIFDDEVESPSGSNDSIGNKLQTWSSMYHRNEPMVVSVEKSRVSDEKPLLLPVRSLKSRVPDENDVDYEARSNCIPIFPQKGFSNDSRRINRQGSLNLQANEDNWVSGEDCEISRVSNLPNSRTMSKHENLKSQISIATEFEVSDSLTMSSSSSIGFSSNSSIESSRSNSPSESQSKTVEDLVNKKYTAYSSHLPPSPAPPPPPPPPLPLPLPPMSKEPFTGEFLERVLLETDDDSEIENIEGLDVDKKADEFIAKFREQIGVQRILSIKKSTKEPKNSSMS